MLCANETARSSPTAGGSPKLPQFMDPIMQLGTSPPSFTAGKYIYGSSAYRPILRHVHAHNVYFLQYD